VLIAQAIRRAGVPLRLIAMEEETRADLIDSVPASERRIIKVGQLGKMLSTLKDFDAGYALMAGQVTPRRLFKGLHPDLKAARILMSLKRRNAETIFGAIAEEIEKLGVHLLDARSFIDEHLASPGCMTGRSFPIDADYVAHGVQIAKESARLDIGQGCVVRKGTVLAVEAFEGTDAMLRRAAALANGHPLRLIKSSRHRQHMLFDVPVAGLATIATMRETNTTILACDAGRTLLLDKDEMIARANAAGICIVGYKTDE